MGGGGFGGLGVGGGGGGRVQSGERKKLEGDGST